MVRWRRFLGRMAAVLAVVTAGAVTMVAPPERPRPGT